MSLMTSLFPYVLAAEQAMDTASKTQNIIYYCIAGVLTIAVLIGISMMSRVETSVKGNALGAVSMLLAIVLTLWYFGIFNVWLLYVAMLVGLLIGIFVAMRVKMIQMPQMVGLLNGFGGAASMLAGVLTMIAATPDDTIFSLVTGGLAIVVGSLTFTGSLIAAGKLNKSLPQRPIVLKQHPLWTGLTLILSIGTVVALAIPSVIANPMAKAILIVVSALISGAFGVIFAIRVGGADMPITISLLNSLSGVAGAIAGMAIEDPLLVAIGGVVGASGLLLTQIMCRAMNRKLADILLGKTSAVSKPSAKKEAPVQAAPKAEPVAEQKLTPEQCCGAWLKDAERVIIVPGYGMALSQAQSTVKQLMTELEQCGKNVEFAIHPVAGRMPGHMNVLLAEVDIPYDKLHEMQDINPQFKDTDVAIVIGANDVVNPAANTAEGTPIYGMPILDVADAKHVIICNYDKLPGYAGVENPLYKDGQEDKIALMLGDAKATLGTIMKAFRQKDTDDAPVTADADTKEMTPELRCGQWLRAADRVIIVPGYGMALSQAQSIVKQLMTELEQEGKTVDFAIHPVAGRMPGHMNVLLAEVDIPYDKLHEMQDINPQFKDTDVAIVIGANDVVNPAANTAEGTPIYGMPILDVADAKHVIICNYDKLPGYAGVDNPLYKDGQDDKITLMLGDAKATLGEIIQAFRVCEVPDAAADGEDVAPETTCADWLKSAERVIIVPGYGMALSQAQSTVKQLMMELDQAGKTVDFAIHPVAGRMPGHMNVLLAEVDIPYDKLHEMKDINPEFKNADVAIVIGANDVVNPAANTAEGTPIYGMPILDVADAKHVIICNFDKLPGYAGVDNPLYEDGKADHITLMLGDAKDTLNLILRAFRC
jgi:NAD(P) transhydrogenase subunit beta